MSAIPSKVTQAEIDAFRGTFRTLKKAVTLDGTQEKRLQFAVGQNLWKVERRYLAVSPPEGWETVGLGSAIPGVSGPIEAYNRLS